MVVALTDNVQGVLLVSFNQNGILPMVVPMVTEAREESAVALMSVTLDETVALVAEAEGMPVTLLVAVTVSIRVVVRTIVLLAVEVIELSVDVFSGPLMVELGKGAFVESAGSDNVSKLPVRYSEN